MRKYVYVGSIASKTTLFYTAILSVVFSPKFFVFIFIFIFIVKFEPRNTLLEIFVLYYRKMRLNWVYFLLFCLRIMILIEAIKLLPLLRKYQWWTRPVHSLQCNHFLGKTIFSWKQNQILACRTLLLSSSHLSHFPI